MSVTSLLAIYGTGFIGIHVGWFMLQEKYEPDPQRRLHPFQRLYRRYMNNRNNDKSN